MRWLFTHQHFVYLGLAYRPYLGEGLAPYATHLVLAPSIEMRAEPNETSETATRVVSGTGVTIEEKGATLIKDSMRMIGVPYLWGGVSGNGIDCSGFARLLHRWIGIDIPRDADMQYQATKPVEPPFEVGDLLFFGDGDRRITHVGISLGGWKMIHSSRSHNGVYIDDVQNRESLKEIFVSAGSFIR